MSSCIECAPTTYNPIAGGTCDTIPGGHMSPDGVIVEACDESTVLIWDEGPNREYCKPCRAFFFSDCSTLQEDVKSYSYGYSIYDPSSNHHVTYFHPTLTFADTRANCSLLMSDKVHCLALL